MMPLDRSRIPTTHSCKGGVIPLLVHGETNADFQDLLKVCARMAVYPEAIQAAAVKLRSQSRWSKWNTARMGASPKT